MAKQDFSGVWQSVYYFKSPLEPGLHTSEHNVKIHQQDDTLILESLPNAEKTYLAIRLKLDGRTATGTWEETTAEGGPYKGARYTGAVQLILSEDDDTFDGMYLVAGMRMEIKANYWTIKRT